MNEVFLSDCTRARKYLHFLSYYVHGYRMATLLISITTQIHIQLYRKEMNCDEAILK